MQLAELQSVATNIVVISVALLTVTIVVSSFAWRGLLHNTGLLSLQGRREISAAIIWVNAVFFTFFGFVIAMAYVGPDMVQIVIFFGALILGAIEMVYFAFIFFRYILRHRRLPRFQFSRSKEPDVEGREKVGMVVYSASVFNLTLATFSFAFSVVTAMDATVGTGIRLNPAEDVDFSRWTLSAGTLSFFFGFMLLGCGKFVDLLRFLGSNDKGGEVQDSNPEDQGPTDRDETADQQVGNCRKSPEQVSDRV